MYVSLSCVVKLYQAILYGLNVAGYSRNMSKKNMNYSTQHFFQVWGFPSDGPSGEAPVNVHLYKVGPRAKR